MENYSEEKLKYLEDPEKYWIEKVKSLTWFENWKKIHNYEPDKHNNQWFIGGKINLSYELLDKKVKGHGDDVALIAFSQFTQTAVNYTINDILDKVSRVAGVLSDCGVRDGDHVSIYMPSIFETVVSMLAAVRIGVVYNILYTVQPVSAMAIGLDDFKPKVIITTNCELTSNEEFFNPKQYIDNVLDQCEHKPDKIIVFQRKCAKPAEIFSPRDVDWDEVLKTAKPHDCVPIEINRPLFVIYTSGTTGKPKGVVASSLYVVSNSLSVGTALIGSPPKPREHKALYCSTYYFWIGGQMFAFYMPLYQRMPFIIWERTSHKIHFEDTLKILADYEVTSIITPTPVIRMFIKQDPNDEIYNLYKHRLNVKQIYIGGLPGDEATFKWIQKHITPNHSQLYALTEGGLITTANTSNGQTFSDHPAMSSGNIIPGITVKILRPDGTEADVDEIGRIALKLPVPTLSSGFLGDDNGQIFISSYLTTFPGYFDTYDEGRFDSKGNLYVLNRASSVFKIKGQRFSCDALEEVIMSHPDVSECIVVTRIRDYAELPVGLFVTNEIVQKCGQDIAHELQELIVQQLGDLIRFDELIHVNELPKTQTGKIARGTIKEIVRNSVKGQIDLQVT